MAAVSGEQGCKAVSGAFDQARAGGLGRTNTAPSSSLPQSYLKQKPCQRGHSWPLRSRTLVVCLRGKKNNPSFQVRFWLASKD